MDPGMLDEYEGLTSRTWIKVHQSILCCHTLPFLWQEHILYIYDLRRLLFRTSDDIFVYPSLKLTKTLNLQKKDRSGPSRRQKHFRTTSCSGDVWSTLLKIRAALSLHPLEGSERFSLVPINQSTRQSIDRPIDPIPTRPTDR